MLFDLVLKFWATPENIIGLALNIVMIVSMCFVFHAWGEKWWKSIMPLYGTYLLYKHTWKGKKWVFLITLFFNIVNARCLAFARKHIVTNIWHTIKIYIETEKLDIDISMEQLLVCLLAFLVSALISFLLTRITYMKVCGSLNINNVFLKIGTFILPEVFLLVDYIYYTNKISKNVNLETKEERW